MTPLRVHVLLGVGLALAGCAKPQGSPGFALADRLPAQVGNFTRGNAVPAPPGDNYEIASVRYVATGSWANVRILAPPVAPGSQDRFREVTMFNARDGAIRGMLDQAARLGEGSLRRQPDFVVSRNDAPLSMACSDVQMPYAQGLIWRYFICTGSVDGLIVTVSMNLRHQPDQMAVATNVVGQFSLQMLASIANPGSAAPIPQAPAAPSNVLPNPFLGRPPLRV